MVHLDSATIDALAERIAAIVLRRMSSPIVREAAEQGITLREPPASQPAALARPPKVEATVAPTKPRVRKAAPPPAVVPTTIPTHHLCIGHAGHECVVEVPRKRMRCRACKKAHKAEYMAAYWKRPEVIAKYGATRSAPATPATSGDAVQRDETPVTSCDVVQQAAPPAPVDQVKKTARPPKTTAAKPVPAPAKPKAAPLTAAEKAARFAAAHDAPEKPVVEKPRPARPPVPEDGLSLGDIHRRTGLPFSILKGRVEQGLLKVVNPDERPPRYTPQSVEDLERVFRVKGRAAS